MAVTTARTFASYNPGTCDWQDSLVVRPGYVETDQYRREGFRLGIEAAARIVENGYRCRSCGQVFLGNSGHSDADCSQADPNWGDATDTDKAAAIRAIDVDEVLAGLPTVAAGRSVVEVCPICDIAGCHHIRGAILPPLAGMEGSLYIDEDGDLCITGREWNLVACPALDASTNWSMLNPDVIHEIIRRWDAFTPPAPDAVARSLAEARAEIEVLTAFIDSMVMTTPGWQETEAGKALRVRGDVAHLAVNEGDLCALVMRTARTALAKEEEVVCTCGAGHGSLEGHTDWCDWVENSPAALAQKEGE